MLMEVGFHLEHGHATISRWVVRVLAWVDRTPAPADQPVPFAAGICHCGRIAGRSGAAGGLFCGRLGPALLVLTFGHFVHLFRRW